MQKKCCSLPPSPRSDGDMFVPSWTPSGDGVRSSPETPVSLIASLQCKEPWGGCAKGTVMGSGLGPSRPGFLRVCSHRLQQQFPAWQKGIQDAGFPATFPCSQSGEGHETWESRDPRQRLVPRVWPLQMKDPRLRGKQTQTIKAHPLAESTPPSLQDEKQSALAKGPV